jgi:prophage antirepressor-like protein
MTDLTVPKPHASDGRRKAALTLQTMSLGAMTLDVVDIAGDPWFYAPSLARTLEYKDARDMLRGVPEDETAVHFAHVPSAPGAEGTAPRRDATFLSEPGFYRVVFRSRATVAEPFKRWVTREVLPSIRKTGQYKLHKEAAALGVSFDFTPAQWEWLKLRPYLVDLLPLAAAGYNSVEITRMLGYNTPKGITARKQMDKLKELGFLPQVIEPRVKRLERQIKAERKALPAP